MTKDIRKLQKQLLMEELKRQGKAPRTRLWIALGLTLLVLVAAGTLWYRATLQARLEETFQRGQELRQAGEFQGAIELFAGLQRDYPDFARSAAALYQVAEMQDLYLGGYNDALLNYLLLERDYPEADQVPAARRQVATLYKYRLGNCSEAIPAYQKVLDQEKEERDLLQYEVADCYFRLNNFNQARIEFEGLINNDPESALVAEVQYRIAVTYALEGQLPEAAGAYRRVMERWPESPYALEASFGLATVLEEQEELKQALEILESLEGIYPNREVLERKAAQVRERIEKKKKAI